MSDKHALYVFLAWVLLMPFTTVHAYRCYGSDSTANVSSIAPPFYIIGAIYDRVVFNKRCLHTEEQR